MIKMTASRPRPLVAGNWKMNGLVQGVGELDAIATGVAAGETGEAEVLICPPFTLVSRLAAAAAGQHIRIGAQDCHPKSSGAHTGDVSAEMLKDAGASHVIVGHSERRTDHGETDVLVKAKAEAALRAGLVAIVCIGETRAEREAGKTLDIVGSQLDASLPAGATPVNTVIAYEPVWAIGTGLTPTVGDVKAVHDFIRARLAATLGGQAGGVRILYGGSVKPVNAAELMAVDNVDGALVGGASLKAADFLGIAAAYR
jgi:triosephosphate isomerase